MRPRIVPFGAAAAVILGALHLIGALWSPVVALPVAVIFFSAGIGLQRGIAWAGYGSALFSLAIVAGSAVGPFPNGPALPLAALYLIPSVLFGLSGRALGKGTLRSAAPWLAVSASTFVVLLMLHPFVLPTGSMEDTLLVGDQLFVQQLGLGSPCRGELAVIRKPGDSQQFFIKRVVAIEGDRVRLKDKRLYVNGEQRKEPYARHKTDFVDSFRDQFPQPPTIPVSDEWAQTLNASHGELTVPQGHVFVLGDNRDNSLDSRYFGFVPLRDIVARPRLVYFSVEDLTGQPAMLHPASIRWNRVLKWL